MKGDHPEQGWQQGKESTPTGLATTKGVHPQQGWQQREESVTNRDRQQFRSLPTTRLDSNFGVFQQQGWTATEESSNSKVGSNDQDCRQQAWQQLANPSATRSVATKKTVGNKPGSN